jgi:excinuclease UvrABC ATPase subunit
MKDIIIEGVRTNNLKNISVRLKKNAINLIVGPSGSGKSSLAYDTIAQIGQHELNSMYADAVKEPEYTVDRYENMVVTVPVKQINTNSNVHSTIGTYFSLNACIAKIFASLLDQPYDFFVLNKTENVCPNCLGLGYTKTLDENKIIDFNKTISEVPIRCWTKNKDFYRQILLKFCEEEKIPADKKFKQLSKKQQELLLNGTGNEQYEIKYTSSKVPHRRKTKYFGPMTGTPMLKRFSPSADFFSELPCAACQGEKFESGHREYKLCGYSVGEAMLLPFSELVIWIKAIRNQYDCSAIDFSLNQLEVFAKKATELNVGYLFLNRNIPSLSGGELQRLRLIQIFSTELTDLLIVLDEPLAGLSTKEKQVVYENIKTLAKKHTLLVIDHHDMFLNDAAQIIALGEGSGRNGGNLIDAKKYIEKQSKVMNYPVRKAGKIIDVAVEGNVYSYKGIDVRIADKSLNIISGQSGVGKSTLLKEYLPRFFDDYNYVSQKPREGNSHSSIATYLGIMGGISKAFSPTSGKDVDLFSNSSTSKGACKTCGGTGFITYGSDSQSQVILSCKDCSGTGFDKKLRKYVIQKKSILDIWNMTIDEGVEFFKEVDKSVAETLRRAQSLLLGHLRIGEKLSSLSGGENIRIKLVSALKGKFEVYGIDEPFKGLNNEEIFAVVKALDALCGQGKTIIVVDHEENSFKYFSRHLELVNENGILTGRPV